MITKKSYRQLEKISSAALLEEANHLKLIYYSIFTMTIIVLILIIWSMLTTVKEITVAYGEIIPEGQVQLVEHLEGGIVAKVLVKNGAQVEKNQVIAELDPTTKKAELDEFKSRQIALTLNRERLQSFINKQEINIQKCKEQLKKSSDLSDSEINKLLFAEKVHLDSQMQQRQDSLLVLNNIIQQRKEKLQELIQQGTVAKKQIAIYTKQIKMYEKLDEKHYIAHKDYLSLLRDANQADAEDMRITNQISQAKEAISESYNKLNELNSQLTQNAFSELGKSNDEAEEVKHKIEKLDYQLAHLEIRAPISGIVKGIRVFPTNSVQPGDKLMEIVPNDQTLIAEAQVSPRDIGFIHLNSPAIIKILAYDFTRYGGIDGTITDISASTFLDPQGKPYYKITAKLDKQYLDNKRLSPGMTIEANIITGEKTVLQYLLRPVQRASYAAFKEK